MAQQLHPLLGLQHRSSQGQHHGFLADHIAPRTVPLRLLTSFTGVLTEAPVKRVLVSQLETRYLCQKLLSTYARSYLRLEFLAAAAKEQCFETRPGLAVRVACVCD